MRVVPKVSRVRGWGRRACIPYVSSISPVYPCDIQEACYLKLSVALPNFLTDPHGFSLVGSGHYIHQKGQSNSNLSIEAQKGLPLAQAFERCSKQSELVLIDAFWVPSRVLAVRSSTKPSNRSKRRDQPCCVAWPGWIRNNGDGVETKRDLLKGMH